MSWLRHIAATLLVVLAACQDITQPKVPAVTRAAVTPSASTGPFAYVVNNGSSTVSVIDIASNTVVTSIALGSRVLPSQVDITPDGAFAYVTLGAANEVAVIETATNTVTTTINVAQAQPSGLVISPDGAFVYLMYGRVNSDVSVIEVATNTVVATVPVGLGGSGIAIRPDGAFVYVVGFGSGQNSVRVIETKTNSVVATIPLAGNVTDLVITPDGALAYLPIGSLNQVFVVSLASNTVVANLPVPFRPNAIALTPDGAFAYISHVFGPVSILETATNTIVATIPTGQQYRPGAIDFTSDGAFAYLASPARSIVPGLVRVIETATNTIVASIAVELNPSFLAITPLPPTISVAIDIKPSSDPNSINCTNDKGVIPVAILTTPDFDATTVDHTTATFEGATETHIDKKTGLPRRHEEDVDGDGDTDLVFHFRYGDTNLDCSSTEGTLTGETFDGTPIEGTDAVRTVGG